MKTIKVMVKDGKISTDLSGFEGASCTDAARRLQACLAALGVKLDVEALSPKPKPEALGAVAETEAHKT